MDHDTPAYRKKKPSSKSLAQKRSDHRHEYELCIIKSLLYSWGERCRICGRFRSNRRSDHDLLKPASLKKPAIGLNDYLSVSQMKEKYPGIRVYELDFCGSEKVYKEILA